MNIKKNLKLKNTLIKCGIVVFLFVGIFLIFFYKQYKDYTHNFNEKISAIFNVIQEKYPDVDKNELMEILNSENTSNLDLFREYGIDINENSVILINDNYFNKYLIVSLSILLILAIALISLFLMYNKSKDRKIKEITKYIEEINKKNYKLNIEDNSEGELSILKNELYKTTVMLKEVAENSVNDKINLKNSLSDISHQIKTPLTSILIMLNNILDDKNMDENIRNDFIKDIQREITNIQFLVESLLKLSKIDSNSVTFIKKHIKIKELVGEATKNVSIICDLKNIKIDVFGNDTDEIICDIKWQIEAVTNILKNCVEHSKENSKIEIKYEQNKMYSKIEIKDYGVGIDKKDLPHIFERFYKGKNSSKDSVGIGLALSKSIIESENGFIQVESVVLNNGNIGRKVTARKSNNKDDNRLTLREFKSLIPTISLSTVIGSIIGILPGLGAAVAPFISYGQAKSISKHPERFGHGALEGVAAAESANNAVCGANLIPLFSFGIPGSTDAALMMSVFMINGIEFGPMIFQKHTDLVYGIYVTGLIAIAGYFLIGMTCARKIGEVISRISVKVLYPSVLIISFIGVFADKYSTFSLIIFVVFGIIGYFMKKFEFPIPPLIISFMLGLQFETNLRQALAISDSGFLIFLMRPISCILIMFSFMLLAWNIWRSIKGNKSEDVLYEE